MFADDQVRVVEGGNGSSREWNQCSMLIAATTGRSGRMVAAGSGDGTEGVQNIAQSLGR